MAIILQRDRQADSHILDVIAEMLYQEFSANKQSALFQSKLR
jgi:hypothetical protein